ncbi:MAG: diguanylate cyclase [Actinophytocola sp.]|uniref:putative bifunctional diguanylate cyclase/phosphodiesterase n=1 Tax=Actinophytocola sp. TaxID=1872138 RepID=UPI003C74751A
MPQPDSGSDPLPTSQDGARAREQLVRKWTYLLSGTAVVRQDPDEVSRELRRLLDILCAIASRDPFDTSAVEQVGEQVVAMGYVGDDGLRRTVEVLGKGLPALPEFGPVEAHAERIALVIGALATGFLAATRRAVFEQQEQMNLSMLKAVRDAKWNLRESEALFAEVVTSSSSGIMIVALDGQLVRTNGAICDILGYTTDELTGMSLYDLVHADTAEMLREAIRAVVDGGQDRVRQSQRLLRKDGDVARISLSASLLRDPDGAPSHFVSVIEDGTELMLLQSELSRQALHDVLTGLPNRQFFGTHLESAIRRADRAYGVTLLHLDLDAFGMVCNSLGQSAGERLLVHVAQQLKAVLAREKAMVARFDGDEFAVLVENTATTPDITTIASAINGMLAEPVYVDGHGLAVSASIGAVHGVSSAQDPAELLRAADQALRRAKSKGRGQWELFDPGQDSVERSAQALAVVMPGAWEQGEITVRYRPVVRLADGGIAGVEAVLHWEREEEPVPHERCVELAEMTGLILPLGEWLLGTAGGQVQWWERQGFASPLTIALTAHQASDADLVSKVAQALDHTGLRATQLVVGMPVDVVRVPEAADNLGVLAEMGVATALDNLDLGPDDLAAVQDNPVDSIRVARRLVDRQARAEADYVAALIPVLRDTGAIVVVDGIGTAEQAAWWRAAGADLATGPHFGPDHSADTFQAAFIS